MTSRRRSQGGAAFVSRREAMNDKMNGIQVRIMRLPHAADLPFPEY
jgi:hypothetical protein